MEGQRYKLKKKHFQKQKIFELFTIIKYFKKLSQTTLIDKKTHLGFEKRKMNYQVLYSFQRKHFISK